MGEPYETKTGIIKVGGILLIISGVLFFVQYLFLVPLPTPRGVDSDLMTWLMDWVSQLFFAACFVLLGIRVLYISGREEGQNFSN